jgi:hypothetical protein
MRAAWFLLTMILMAGLIANGQSFKVQCPTSTITHPSTLNSVTLVNTEPAYNGATTYSTDPQGGYVVPATHVNGAIKCQQVSGGDGFATMGDGTQTYLFSFGPLSGISDIAKGLPGTQFPGIFNTVATNLVPGDPATKDGAQDNPYVQGDPSIFTFNGAVGLAPDLDNSGALDGHVDVRQVMDVGVMNGNFPAPLIAIDEDDELFLTLTNLVW